MSEINVKEYFCRPTDERILIAFCMKDLTNYFSIRSKLSASDFLYESHELIMLLFESLVSQGASKLEPDLLVSVASAGGTLADIGGINYIKAINDISVDQSNFDLYLSAVLEASTKFNLYTLLSSSMESISTNAKDGLSSADLLSSVESSILDLSMTGLNIGEPQDMRENLIEYIETKRNAKIDICGMSTGYPILDKQIDGLTPGGLHIIAARKKMGKSTFLSNIAGHVAFILNVPVLYVDTEMPFAEEFRPRMLSIMSGVKERDIKHGGYDDITYKRLLTAEKIISRGKLFHEYMPGYSVDKLVALYKKYKHKEKIGLMVFDYLKEPDSSSVDRQRKEYQILGDVTTKLKDLAGQLHVPALTAVQLNRDNDVADSDRIARFADVLCIWTTRTNDEMNLGSSNCGSHKLIIRDTRRGGATPIEGIGYKFYKEFLKIKEVPIDQQYFINFDKVINADASESDEGMGNEELPAL